VATSAHTTGSGQTFEYLYSAINKKPFVTPLGYAVCRIAQSSLFALLLKVWQILFSEAKKRIITFIIHKKLAKTSLISLSRVIRHLRIDYR
jgi:hypothetical protein